MLNIEDFIQSGQLFDGHYKFIKPLSTDGGTADVWLAEDTNTIDNSVDDEGNGQISEEKRGMLVAIKIYRPKNALDVEGEQRFRDEYKIVYECRHANLLQPTSYSIFEEVPYLVLPFCKFGSSEQLIGKNQTNEEIWKFILDVSSGLNRLHTNEPPIIHQDIKPANVLIDNTRNFAITDFGISSKSGGAHGYYFDEENSGTLAYMAPERFLEGIEPMSQSDIWAFGATLFEVLTGKVPFGEEGGSVQLSDNWSMPVIPNVSSDIQRLVSSCLAKDPERRPTAAQIKAAAMVRQYPIKSKKWIYVLLAIFVIFGVGSAVFFATKSSPVTVTVVEKTKPINYPAMFNEALDRMNSDDKDTFTLGLQQMDSLSNFNYIPAIYEMAFTYGWYSDPISVKRKEMLGIEIFESGDEQYMPKSDIYSNKAVALFQRIMEINDPKYASINANATYRLACYYVMPNKIFQPNNEKGKAFLEKSLEWATKADETDLISKIQKGLSSFEQ